MHVNKDKSALEQLFSDARHMSMQSDDLEEAEVNKFTNRITRDWGEEESQLRSAIYVSFLKEKDVELLRKR